MSGFGDTSPTSMPSHGGFISCSVAAAPLEVGLACIVTAANDLIGTQHTAHPKHTTAEDRTPILPFVGMCSFGVECNKVKLCTTRKEGISST